MPLEGRGTSYSRKRGAIESALSLVMGKGWAPSLLRRVGLQPPVHARSHYIACPRWPEGVRPLRLGFVSDLHAGPTTHPSLHEEAAQALARAEPDVLLLGGDYVFLHASFIDAMMPRLAGVPAPLGRFAVFGNHDLWADDRHIRRALERAGFEVLVNESRTLPEPFGHVSISGIDDPWTGSPDVARAFEGARAVRVLLMHAPETLLLLDDVPFDVAVCGHTHGGHIALPIMGGTPIVTAGPLSRRYSEGRFSVDGRAVIVSRGIGATESPLRLFADPDVRIITLGR